jgi:hypothetical protein
MAEEKVKKRRRGALGRRLMKVPLIRRMYVRRMLKFIDKSKAKGRRLPPEIYELSRQLSRVPEADRASALETALKAGPDGIGDSVPGSNRQLRRAASAQQRQSGKGQGRYRPGGGVASPTAVTPPPRPSTGRTRPGSGRSKPTGRKSK